GGGGGGGGGGGREGGGELGALGDVSGRLARRRFADGSLDLDLPTAEIEIGPDGQPRGVVQAPRTRAHRAIEEAMLAANRAVAERLVAAEAPALFRNHEPPAHEDAEALLALLAKLGLLRARPVPEL